MLEKILMTGFVLLIIFGLTFVITYWADRYSYDTPKKTAVKHAFVMCGIVAIIILLMICGVDIF